MLRSKSIKGRLIATVVISQALLAAGLLFAGVFYTHRRLVAALEIPAGPDHHWNLTLGNVPYRVSRVSHVPVLDREEGQFFQPQALTIVYASPLIRVQEQTWAAGVFIAVASLILLGATVLL